MQHRRQVVGAIFICDAIEVAPVLILRASEIPARVWFENVLQFFALLTGIASRYKRVNIAALAIPIAIYLYTAAMSFIQPVAL